jgi:hypothetical protein
MGSDMTAGKVRVGFFSFTEITDPAEHRSYNEWHMLDHMPEQFPISGIAFGQRWVSTPALRARRAVSDPALDPTHYLTCYLMTEPLDATLREFYEHGRALGEVGRFHRHRRALLSGPFAVEGGDAASRVMVRAEAVPYRPHRSIYVVVEDAARAADGAQHRNALLEVPGVAGAWTFGPHDRGPAEARITVVWIDEAPDATAGAISSIESGRAADAGVSFAGAFDVITPWQWNWFDR